MLNSEQVEQIKEQLLGQVDKLFPEEKREAAKRQITAMGSEELESFLKQNNLAGEQQNPFRLIASGQVPSYSVDENKNCLAVLELNPISEGHTLAIPKRPVKEGKKVPTYLKNFAKKVAKKLKTKLKAKDVAVVPTPMFDETIINILPVYKDETLNSPRKQASQEDLQTLQNKINKKIIKKTKVKPKEIKKDEKLWLPKRIP